MQIAVLDSSAVLAVVHHEPGGEKLAALVEARQTDLLISSVNFCEMVTKLIRDGVTPEDARRTLRWWKVYVVDFDLAQAERAGELTLATQSAGLSLGDRACLALAMSRNARVLTTDQAWSKVKLGLHIEVLR